MTEKVSKSLKEVWEWKEACYQELKDLPPHERIAHIEREANRILEEQGIREYPGWRWDVQASKEKCWGRLGRSRNVRGRRRLNSISYSAP